MIADRIIKADDVTGAWIQYIDLLLDTPTPHELFHVIVQVAQPATESDPARRLIETFMDEWMALGKNVFPIRAVRNTIFPRNTSLECRTPQQFAQRYRDDYPRIRALHTQNRRGTYFGRLVQAQRSRDGHTYDQLNDTIDKLRDERSTGTMFEVDMGHELEKDFPDMGIYQTEHNHLNSMGFPCMSHMGFQRDGDRVHIVAFYRNQSVGRRAYGNMLGLGQLCEYIARHAGLQCGQLTMVAGRAQLDTRINLLKKHLPAIRNKYEEQR